MKSKRVIVVILIFSFVVVSCFYWHNFNKNRANYVSMRVTTVLNSFIEGQQNQGTREEYNQGENKYYMVNLNKTDNKAEIFQNTLIVLNNDKSLPPVKLDEFSITQSSNITTHVSVEYTAAFGVKKHLKLVLTNKLLSFDSNSDKQ